MVPSTPEPSSSSSSISSSTSSFSSSYRSRASSYFSRPRRPAASARSRTARRSGRLRSSRCPSSSPRSSPSAAIFFRSAFRVLVPGCGAASRPTPTPSTVARNKVPSCPLRLSAIDPPTPPRGPARARVIGCPGRPGTGTSRTLINSEVERNILHSTIRRGETRAATGLGGRPAGTARSPLAGGPDSLGGERSLRRKHLELDCTPL
jgi:hypothetical protein